MKVRIVEEKPRFEDGVVTSTTLVFFEDSSGEMTCWVEQNGSTCWVDQNGSTCSRWPVYELEDHPLGSSIKSALFHCNTVDEAVETARNLPGYWEMWDATDYARVSGSLIRWERLASYCEDEDDLDWILEEMDADTEEHVVLHGKVSFANRLLMESLEGKEG